MHGATEIPDPPSSPLGRIASGLHRAAELVVALMFAAVFVIFIFKIVMRYLEHDEAAWSDEVSVILFVWIIFWASALVVRERDQISFDLVYRILPPGGRRVMAVLRLLLVGGIFLWAAPGAIDYILFLWRERTPVLGLRLDWVYSCFGLFMVAVVIRSAVALAALLGRGWRAKL